MVTKKELQEKIKHPKIELLEKRIELMKKENKKITKYLIYILILIILMTFFDIFAIILNNFS